MCQSIRGRLHPPVLEQETLDAVLWVGALSGPARVHLQEHVWGKGVVGLQGHLEEQRVLALQGYGIAVAVGVGLISVQAHSQPQLNGGVELHQGEGGDPTTKWIKCSDVPVLHLNIFLFAWTKKKKISTKKDTRLTTPCSRRLECCVCNVVDTHTSRRLSYRVGWWCAPCSGSRSACFGTQCGFCSPKNKKHMT